MFVVPAVTPHTVPVAFTVPTAVVPLAHVPPALVLASVVHCPTQVVGVPVIVAGNGLQVATVLNAHVVGNV